MFKTIKILHISICSFVLVFSSFSCNSNIIVPEVVFVNEFKRVVTNDISFVKEDFFIPQKDNPFMSIEHNALGRHIYSFYSFTGTEVVTVILYDYMNSIHIEETDLMWKSIVSIWENNIASVSGKNKEGDTFEIAIDREEPSKIRVQYNDTIYCNYIETEPEEETLPLPIITYIDSLLGPY